ncbi:hypothetical protein [Pseudonocardia abyssalis]|uniref:DUF4365 domain-containing protein n=1 Tax=Pseudonocardia abyssalis TaxID=2792008 RepID=A0ABS6V285_9PSEU|nr:hypothetical protein [Pseudonocardia abyssalis]MBW0114174.1 hypothetical protein [Pseudonocardia abyssalis]MBW0138567.1 hypothetical protein [Pseudonocardia abyssalis]
MKRGRPRKDANRQIGHLAEVSVMKVCALADYISSINNEDFGEDLLVQTCIEQEMDDSKIWIQVKGFKGTSLRDSASPKAVAISNGHLARWVKSADLAVIVRWDVTNDCGWYLIPDGSDYSKRIPVDKSGTQTIKFDKRQAFDIPAVKILAWKTRFRHAMRNIATISHLKSLGELDGKETLDLQHELYDRLAQIAFDIGTLLPNGKDGWMISADFQEIVFEYTRSRREDPSPSPLGNLLLADMNEDFSDAEMIHTVILESVYHALVRFQAAYIPAEAAMPAELFAEIVNFLALIIGSVYTRDTLGWA